VLDDLAEQEVAALAVENSTAVKTSAYASAASSWEGSSAIEGCMRSKGMSLSRLSASASRLAEAGESASPGAPARGLEELRQALVDPDGHRCCGSSWR
jgi:hypothetical protein